MEESGAEYMEVDEESSLLLCEGNGGILEQLLLVLYLSYKNIPGPVV